MDKRVHFSPILRRVNGSTLSHGPQSTVTDKRDKNIVSRSHNYVRTPPVPWFSHYYLYKCQSVLALMIHAYAPLCFLTCHSLLLSSAQHN